MEIEVEILKLLNRTPTLSPPVIVAPDSHRTQVVYCFLTIHIPWHTPDLYKYNLR